MVRPPSNTYDFAANLERRLRTSRSGDKSPAAAASTAPQAHGIEAILKRAEERAALSGEFDPATILDKDVADDVRIAVLSRLAPASVILPSGESVRWSLQRSTRVNVLQRLAESGELDSRLGETLPDTDNFGTMLRQVLAKDSKLDIDSLKSQEVLALASVLEATSNLPLIKLDQAKVHRSIAQARYLADYGMLLKDGFIGRERELGTLRNFCVTPPSGGMFDSIVLSGLGGAGKSSLLAKLAHGIVTEGLATLVVLDFDRPGIDPSDTYWLEMEIARQVGSQEPALDSELRTVRETARGIRAQARDNFQSSDSERSFRSIVSSVRLGLQSHSLAQRPFLLILDTFEEVVQRQLVDKLMEWLKEIADHLYGIRLRVIFSGRLFDEGIAQLRRYGTVPEVKVDELSPEVTEELLRMQGVPDSWAQRLARSNVLPRRPLELKLLARVIASGNLGSVEELENEVRAGGAAARELYAGLVYRRALLRVGKETQTIAFPGLVLRYLTAELIREVLVPALHLPRMEEEAAQRSLEALSRYEWLGYRQGDEVWHRKDLRRSTLKAMIASDREKATRIHEGAVRYFDDKRDEQSRAEAIYHRLMLMETPQSGEDLDEDELARASKRIGGDIVDLPMPAQALLRFAGNLGIKVEDVPLLADRHRRKAYQSLGPHLVDAREYGQALKLIQDSDRLPNNQLDPWEVKTLFATASWDAIPPWGDRLETRDAVRNLANRLFPGAIIAPDMLDMPEIERALAAPASPNLSRQGVELDTNLERLAIGLILVNAHHPFGNGMLQALAFQSGSGGFLSHAGRTPQVQRRLALLDLLHRDPTHERRAIAVTPLNARLDNRWVQVVTSIARRCKDRDAARGLDAIASEVGAVLQMQRSQTVRGVLGAVNGLATQNKQLREVWFWLDEASHDEQFELLRSPDSDFRPPCRYALLETFPGDGDLEALGEALRAAIPLPMPALDPESIARELKDDPEHSLESYVELADRCGALGDLLLHARASRPSGPKLEAVADAYQRWTDAVRGLFYRSSNQPTTRESAR